MSFDVTIKKINEVYITVECDVEIVLELADYFKFRIQNYKFHPKVKAGIWDGYIKLFDIRTRTLYAGLYNQLIEYLLSNNYTFQNLDNPYYGRMDVKNNIHMEDIVEYCKSLNLFANGSNITPRDNQYSAIHYALNNFRMVGNSATASGKSLIIYIICRYLIEHNLTDRVLIIFPTTALIRQMKNDFLEYSVNDETFDDSWIHEIFSGKDKNTKHKIVLSTYQSLDKVQTQFYDTFNCVICDEAHLATSKTFLKIFQSCTDVIYRLGFTGSVDNESKTHRLVLTGLLGDIVQLSKTRELIDNNEASDILINCVLLSHADDIRKQFKSIIKIDGETKTVRKTYLEESKFIIEHDARNKFITKLAHQLEGNTILLFSKREHGKLLYDLLKEHSDKQIFYIDGNVKIDNREDIRQYLNVNNDCILVASYKTCSTGMSVRNLHNAIFTFPTKSFTTVVQSVGRLLRLHESKSIARLYDIGDDISWKSRVNHTLDHFNTRIHYYAKSELNYKIIKVNIK